MISFWDKIRLKDDEIVEKYTKKVLEKYDLEGLNEIITEIKKLKKEEHYLGLLMVNLEYKWFVDNETASSELNCSVVDSGREILGYQPINLPPITRVISYQDLQSFHNFLLGSYVNNLGKKLNSEETRKICNNIDVLIMKNLDRFDEIAEIPEINDEYFQKLKKIRWGKNSRNLWLDLNGLRKFAGHPPEKTPLKFLIEHDLLIQFLSGCCAVNENRGEIGQADVIIAYKTYFKLLKTNFSALIDKLDNG